MSNNSEARTVSAPRTVIPTHSTSPLHDHHAALQTAESSTRSPSDPASVNTYAETARQRAQVAPPGRYPVTQAASPPPLQSVQQEQPSQSLLDMTPQAQSGTISMPPDESSHLTRLGQASASPSSKKPARPSYAAAAAATSPPPPKRTGSSSLQRMLGTINEMVSTGFVHVVQSQLNPRQASNLKSVTATLSPSSTRGNREEESEDKDFVKVVGKKGKHKKH